MTCVAIRPAKLEDAQSISDLIGPLAERFVVQGGRPPARAVPGSVMPAAIARCIADREFIYLVGVRDATIVGAVAVRARRHLYHLFVAAALQRQGIGRTLWQAVSTAAIAAGNPGLFTVNAVPNAIPVYECFGFRATGPLLCTDGIARVPMVVAVAVASSAGAPAC